METHDTDSIRFRSHISRQLKNSENDRRDQSALRKGQIS